MNPGFAHEFLDGLLFSFLLFLIIFIFLEDHNDEDKSIR